MFAVRKWIIDELLKDPKWAKKFEAANDSWEIAAVLIDYCVVRGYEVATVEEQD